MSKYLNENQRRLVNKINKLSFEEIKAAYSIDQIVSLLNSFFEYLHSLKEDIKDRRDCAGGALLHARLFRSDEEKRKIEAEMKVLDYVINEMRYLPDNEVVKGEEIDEDD
jgi:hypothetical protein